MITFLKKLKFKKLNRGMTYVELIVVLSIFSIMTSVILFDYNNFQAKIDIKVLASDIALKIVEAQRSAVSGKWNDLASAGWKPSYGIYFELNSPKSFISFVDFNSNDSFNGSNCNGECLDNINITKGNYIKDLKCGGASIPGNKLSIVFRRPDSTAKGSCAGDMEITISSAGTNPVTAGITISPSGRVQIN